MKDASLFMTVLLWINAILLLFMSLYLVPNIKAESKARGNKLVEAGLATWDADGDLIYKDAEND